ncbi:MAG TPA: cytochrome c maturation protein CcmE [Chromatiaceae bacterium]|nr:cytochrome c maturation protein CcmE [Chromatiaceae bacterium]
MKARQKRLLFVALGIAGVGAAAAMALNALRSNIAYFFSPSQVLAREAPADHVFRLGGLVETGTLKRQPDGLTLTFVVTDNAEKVRVSYTGILPDLFSEGRGVVTKGKLGNDGVFYAEEVLAKHDEEYMPPEVAATLKPHSEAAAALDAAQNASKASQVTTQ